MRRYSRFAAVLLAIAFGSSSNAFGAGSDRDTAVKQAVDAVMRPVIARYGIPGVAIGVTIDGERHFVEYGLASKAAQVPVTRDTLFELGSVSKTFTATLAAEAGFEGKLSLNDTVGAYMPKLKGSPIADARLLDLGTHTAGGFPLQLPDEVKNQQQLIAYFRGWKPQFAPGTQRIYANPSVGLLGLVTARAMGTPFEALASGLFHDLGLNRTYINIPAAEAKSYAWGYNRDGNPVHVSPAPLATEAYGVKSNAVDMLRVLEVNMGIGAVPDKVARAIEATHTGYYRAGPLIQDLIWEQYPYPVALETIVAGNSPRMTSAHAVPATALNPPMAPRGDAILNKTGSTAGFGAYVAFIPAKKIGIVILANKSYPNEVRVQAAYEILSRLVK
jgi:beta-lactamase class C